MLETEKRETQPSKKWRAAGARLGKKLNSRAWATISGPTASALEEKRQGCYIFWLQASKLESQGPPTANSPMLSRRSPLWPGLWKLLLDSVGAAALVADYAVICYISQVVFNFRCFYTWHVSLCLCFRQNFINDGICELAIPVSGKKQCGTLHVSGTCDGAVWTIHRLFLECVGEQETYLVYDDEWVADLTNI